MSNDVKKVVVVFDEKSEREAIYVDGVLTGYDFNIYAGDIIYAVGGSDVPFMLEHRSYEVIGSEQWPKSLADLEKCGC